MKIKRVKVESLTPADYNPRKDLQPGDPEYEKIKRSVLEFGCVEPLVVNPRQEYAAEFNEPGPVVVGGHQRLKVLQDLGITDVEVSLVDLPPAREKALNIALNKIGGDWDMDKLVAVLEDLNNEDFDVEITGFSAEEIDRLMDSVTDPGNGRGNGDGGSGSGTGGGPIIQYNLIFNTEGEQKVWYEYLAWLKKEYPDCETIAERVIADIQARGISG